MCSASLSAYLWSLCLFVCTSIIPTLVFFSSSIPLSVLFFTSPYLPLPALSPLHPFPPRLLSLLLAFLVLTLSVELTQFVFTVFCMKYVTRTFMPFKEKEIRKITHGLAFAYLVWKRLYRNSKDEPLQINLACESSDMVHVLGFSFEHENVIIS